MRFILPIKTTTVVFVLAIIFCQSEARTYEIPASRNGRSSKGGATPLSVTTEELLNDIKALADVVEATPVTTTTEKVMEEEEEEGVDAAILAATTTTTATSASENPSTTTFIIDGEELPVAAVSSSSINVDEEEIDDEKIINDLVDAVLMESMKADQQLQRGDDIDAEELPRNAQRYSSDLTDDELLAALAASRRLSNKKPINRNGESPIFRISQNRLDDDDSYYTPRNVDTPATINNFGAQMANTDPRQRQNNFPQSVNQQFLRQSSLNSQANPPRPSDINSGDFSTIIKNDDNEIRCIPKVVHVEETVYNRAMQCHHSYQEKCHMTYITDYTSTTQKKCDTSFKKNCHITFKPTPFDIKVNICHAPFVRKCGNETLGEMICSTHYEDTCETTYKTYEIEQDEPNCRMEMETRCNNITVSLPQFHGTQDENGVALGQTIRQECEEWPVQKCDVQKRNKKKVHPETQCKKIPRNICIPNNCELVRGEEICKEETRTQVQNVPEEECDLQPEENCTMESALVPRLIPKPNCIKVPKEICVNSKTNPQKVSKPIIKQWCYKPSELAVNAPVGPNI